MDKRLLQYLKNEKKLFAILNIKREEPNIITDEFVETFFVTYQQVFLDVFFDFLKMNGNLKETLEKELVMQGGTYLRADYMPKADYIPKVLAYSLIWQRTKQGHNFWCDLHYKWAQYLRDNVVQPLFGKEAAKNFYIRTTNGYDML